MKIKIKVEDKDKYLEIPLNRNEIREVYDELWESIIYYNEKWKKLDKHKKRTYKILAKLQDKLVHLVHDVIDKGAVYELGDNLKIKKKSVHYFERKPRWKKL